MQQGVSPISPTKKKTAKAEKAKKAEKQFAVFAEDDVRAMWPSMEEAVDVAEDAASRHSRTMLIFELVGTIK